MKHDTPVIGVDPGAALERALQEAYTADECRDCTTVSQEIDEFESRLASGRAVHSRDRSNVKVSLGKSKGKPPMRITPPCCPSTKFHTSHRKPYVSEADMQKQADAEQDIKDVRLLRNIDSSSDNENV
ncbi:unnamed protein product [Phytomonas sp. Hart1]|nr:unnamed protein product [Phytomonas sp. Hart1]|eukprot:CCW68670.1 unnamed protein product [Phytomonas sp. isolate Hart1]